MTSSSSRRVRSALLVPLVPLFLGSALAVGTPACGSDGDDGESSTGDGGADGLGGFPVDPAARPTTAECAAAMTAHASVGCDYWATEMDIMSTDEKCFAAFVANTWTTPVHISVSFEGKALPVDRFARIPVGSGPSLTYAAFDAAAGLPPGQVAVLFLAGTTGDPGFFKAFCPVEGAIPGGTRVLDERKQGITGIGHAFHITTDAPVVAYQINPFGGGSAALTGASLLLPTSVWDKTYVAANAYATGTGKPSLNIIANENDTHVTLLPVAAVEGGGGVPGGPAGTPLTFTLARGEHAQISQVDELTGSLVEADRPIGVMAGHQGMYVPKGVGAADHGEQMLPPVRALGSEYVGVMHAPRTTEPAVWRLVGAVDGTVLSWSSDVGGPTTLARGQTVELVTGTPFIVSSQDEAHPFLFFQHMAGSGWEPLKYGMLYIGDPDTVLGVPPKQFMSSYVFFADPTYPVTSLVLVRAKKDGVFADVRLDCAGVVGGWQPIGDYEWARVYLNRNFVPEGACDTGRHVIESAAPFGLWVWGWGTPETERDGGTTKTQSVSYGYPGGMSVAPINPVELHLR